MFACLDVHYEQDRARAASVLFSDWPSPAPDEEHVAEIHGVAPYKPGAFFERELPCLLAVLAKSNAPKAVIIDGYVWLAKDRPGLGVHLHEALGVPVVGVAKTSFHANDMALEVLRGTSAKPLYVTAIGIDPNTALAGVRAMHGAHRVPTLLAHVDRLCRQ